MITCRTCLLALYPYIDRELAEEDVVQVRQHLDECRDCLHLFEFHASLGRLVRVKCQQQQAPDDLRARVVQLLKAERVRLEKMPGKESPSR